MAYKKYVGNTGQYVLVNDPVSVKRNTVASTSNNSTKRPPPPKTTPNTNSRPKPLRPNQNTLPSIKNQSSFGGLSKILGDFNLSKILGGKGGGIGGLFKGFGLGELETEDILLALILYFLYLESGDTELLIILGAFLFL